ncbi:hypothetical protein NIES2119_03735 [[Phormidium ambiguum] IAM M-71]|uniref:Uncharacterized protein n=2 Tax=Floridanema TaxID=3396149 RepID=A0A1U7IRT3_9CYAN|nr:hypothetical protein [Phormidium ambiguum]OKH40069.1 hypothetical protein NIES2119_03735 [Phormidium ambiguum IAM M-71]
MLTLEQIEDAILKLTPDEFEKLLKWVADLDYQRWDEQLEKDIADGKLEALAQEAIADFEAGNCEPI